MSENRDEVTGQFAAEPEPKYGIESVEAEQGYSKMPDPTAEEDWSFNDSAEKAAELWAEVNPEPQDATEVFYQTPAGERVDPNETVSLERAAEDLIAYHDANAESAAKSISKDFADAIDQLRAERIKGDPALEEHYGVKTATPDKPAAVEEATHEPDAFDDVPGLAEETKQALRNPQVRQYLEQTEQDRLQVRQAYTNGLEQARVASLATLAEVVPHLAGLPPAQFEQGLATLSQVDPPAFNKAMNILGRMHQIDQAQQHARQQQAHAEAHEFRAFRVAEDAKLEKLGVDSKMIQQFQSKVEPYFKSLGLSDGDLRGLANDRTLHSAAGQRVLIDAMRYQEIVKAPKPVATRNVPPVQRPGSTMPSGHDDDLTALDRRLTQTGSLKDAERLLNARAKRAG